LLKPTDARITLFQASLDKRWAIFRCENEDLVDGD